MSAKHSSGPWIALFRKTDTEGVNLAFSIEGVDRCSLCSGQSQEHLAPNSFVSEDECRANANLIAAAPDLLSALEGLIEQDRYGGAETVVARYRAARAAISKAKGQS